ncbi:DUF1140 family protein [Staphylococcus arlettae]|uniref:DUF1140 family protein n=1 Tax=Staphylococcus arlettae TaxID=29378 RepID=UPI000D19D917|nr:DUF1140 family protein [Staphylococcus arlettae]PUZ31036.1 DUF1140 domain-containing protein [Staphylococcus arlettae]
MTPNDILLRHAPTIVKTLLQQTDRKYKRFLKFSNTSYNSEVGTSQYWKAVSGMEQTQLELDQLISELAAMDEYTRWSEKLHQDRYKFVEKYDIAMEKYKGKLVE